LADVWFTVHYDDAEEQDEKTERLPAHTYVLSIGSSVFHTMFHGNFAAQHDIDIPDVQPNAFKEMLRYSTFKNCPRRFSQIYVHGRNMLNRRERVAHAVLCAQISHHTVDKCVSDIHAGRVVGLEPTHTIRQTFSITPIPQIFGCNNSS
jgi:hypothetical protein